MFKKLNNKRGFSLVELMVVVAIMGVLASIAIPSFNEYRKSAKKNAYRSDLMSLHKGWLAFGVELDSYCTRETNPRNSNIENVGMASLLNSKLYGTSSATPQRSASCSGGGTLTPSGCTPTANTTPCTGCTGGTNPVFTAFRAARTAGVGPDKHNFIGFGDDNCTAPDLANRQIVGMQGTTSTNEDTDCDLNVASYEAGVYGHISGAEFFGVSINNNGVLSGEQSISANTQTADTGCS